MTPTQRKLYNLKNWIRSFKTKWSNLDKFTIDQQARQELRGWIKDYSLRAVLKAIDSNIPCSGTRQMENLIIKMKTLIEEEPKRREKLAQEMEQYQIT